MSESRPARSARLWLRLFLARGVGGRTVARLLETYGSAEDIFSASARDLRERGFAGVHQAIHAGDLEERLAALRSDLAQWPQVRVLTPADAGYPAKLRAAHSVPPVLFVRGELAPGQPAVAVVGSRRASRRRLQLTLEWCREWAEAGVSVISGLAEGIDGAAHRGALAGGGHTAAVLGTGPDKTYPSAHAALQSRILESGGAVVSQFAPRTPAFPGSFPARNATMAGLADLVVIMQAASGSGACHTAEAAFQCGRPVLVAPSDPADRENAGGLGLLRTRAHAIGSPGDLLEFLQLASRSTTHAQLPPLPAELEIVLAEVDYAGQSLDELSRSLELPAAVILDRLLALELAGAVARQPGPRYVRIR